MVLANPIHVWVWVLRRSMCACRNLCSRGVNSSTSAQHLYQVHIVQMKCGVCKIFMYEPNVAYVPDA
jgi:hypothetical protein